MTLRFFELLQTFSRTLGLTPLNLEWFDDCGQINV